MIIRHSLIQKMKAKHKCNKWWKRIWKRYATETINSPRPPEIRTHAGRCARSEKYVHRKISTEKTLLRLEYRYHSPELIHSYTESDFESSARSFAPSWSAKHLLLTSNIIIKEDVSVNTLRCATLGMKVLKRGMVSRIPTCSYLTHRHTLLKKRDIPKPSDKRPTYLMNRIDNTIHTYIFDFH